MAEPAPSPRPDSDSLEREFQRLRGAVSEYPALRPIVDRIPDKTPDPGAPRSPTNQTAPSGPPEPHLHTHGDGATTKIVEPRVHDPANVTMAGGSTEGVPTSPVFPVTLDFTDYDPGTHLAPRPMRLEDKRDALRARQQIFLNRARELNVQLKQGRIESDEWMRRMMGQVKDLHTTAYAIGYSGRWSEIESRDWGAIGAVIQRQYRFIRRWRAQIDQEGLDSQSLAQLNDRAQKYGAASRESFEKGYGAEVGMPPNVLPAYPGDGTTECYTRCKCRWAINILSKANQDYDCTWKLGVAEHCETCLDRATEWVQLEVRGGALVSDPAPIFAR